MGVGDGSYKREIVLITGSSKVFETKEIFVDKWKESARLFEGIKVTVTYVSVFSNSCGSNFCER